MPVRLAGGAVLIAVNAAILPLTGVIVVATIDSEGNPNFRTANMLI